MAIFLFSAAFACPDACPVAHAQLPDGPAPHAAIPIAAQPALSGTVTAEDGSPLIGVILTLTQPGTRPLTVISDTTGAFRIDAAPPGSYILTATLEGFTPSEQPLTLDFAEPAIVALQMHIATVVSSVNALTPHEQAIQQLHEEEHQRILAVIPNFYLSFDHNPPPLSSAQKYHLAWRAFIDPTTFAFTAAAAGIQQGNGSFAGDRRPDGTYTGYGYGASGYGKRYGAALANGFTGTFLGGAVFPQLLHQDPRYLKGTGTVRHRIAYAIAAAFICRGDNGNWQPNYSFMLGNLATGAISNAYYPSTSRGAGLTFENFAIATASGSLGGLMQEFVLAPLTLHHLKKQQQQQP